jgi:hypothetical protein
MESPDFGSEGRPIIMSNDVMSASAFSRRTVIAAIELMGQMTQTEFTRLLLKWRADLLVRVGDKKVSLAERLNMLIVVLDQNPDLKTDSHNYLADEVVDFVAASFVGPDLEGDTLSPNQEEFRRGLELDGFRINDGSIRRQFPSELRTADRADEISELLSRHALVVPQGHLQQALDAHRRGDWAAANGQIRSFLESLLDELAVKIDPSATSLPSGENRRAKLAASGFLYTYLNEWSMDGKNFINGLMKRLHPHGSHPGLSDEADSTFRLQLVILVAALLLRRFDNLP